MPPKEEEDDHGLCLSDWVGHQQLCNTLRCRFYGSIVDKTENPIPCHKSPKFGSAIQVMLADAHLPRNTLNINVVYTRKLGQSLTYLSLPLAELYGTEVSPTLISTITDAVLDEVRTWQARPLASVYPILYFDALFVKSRQEGPVQTKAVYLALGITMDGEKERLSESEGAKFWLSVFTELHNRGVTDCFIARVDGLQGLPEAIEAVFPKTQVQLCIVHEVRNSLKYVPWKERWAVAADLRAIYGAATLHDAAHALERFAERWDAKYPAISPSWLADRDRLTVFFDYPPAIRRVVYTTNAIESLNYSLCRVWRLQAGLRLVRDIACSPHTRPPDQKSR
jgi:transposase-like protein